jgi:hypothetical protein
MNKIIGASYCPFCVKVQSYFVKQNIEHVWVDTETE